MVLRRKVKIQVIYEKSIPSIKKKKEHKKPSEEFVLYLLKPVTQARFSSLEDLNHHSSKGVQEI